MHLPIRNLLAALTGLITLAGCASIGPPRPPSLELPRPPSDLRVARKGNRVKLTWTVPEHTTDRQSVRYLGNTRICRSLDPAIKIELVVKNCDPVGEAAPPPDFAGARKSPAQKLSANYTDTLPSALQRQQPTGFVTYAVEVLNTAGKGAGISNQVHVPLLPTLPPFGGFAAQLTAQGVSLSWLCPAPTNGASGEKYLFRIYRHLANGAGASRIAELDATPCAAGPQTQPPERIPTSFLDQTFEWENTYVYRGAVVSVLESPGKPIVEVEGDGTPELNVVAHDVFPPAVPSGLQAVFSGPGQSPFIDLIWAPVADADLDGYNIYRHEPGGAAVKLNAEPVKTPAYRDTQVVAGKKYLYSVSAVDQRGNESALSDEAGESIP